MESFRMVLHSNDSRNQDYKPGLRTKKEFEILEIHIEKKNISHAETLQIVIATEQREEFGKVSVRTRCRVHRIPGAGPRTLGPSLSNATG